MAMSMSPSPLYSPGFDGVLPEERSTNQSPEPAKRTTRSV